MQKPGDNPSAPLVSPSSGLPLQLVRQSEEDQEFLESADGKERFPVINGVPSFVPITIKKKRHEAGSAFSVSGDLRNIHRTFSDEWAETTESDLSFIYTFDDLVRLHREVWLYDIVDFSSYERVLDIGCGNGKESMALASIFPNAFIYGCDINNNIFSISSTCSEETRVRFIHASLQSLPFERGSFDHVHCQGVLHHNRSTFEALGQIVEYVKPGGTLFIWIYAKEDRYVVRGIRGLSIRLYWRFSHSARVLLSRSPRFFRDIGISLLSLGLHPLVRRRSLHPESWRLSNTRHGIRDAFTPKFAHEHGLNETIEKLEELGFVDLRIQRAGHYKHLFQRRLVGIGLLATKTALNSSQIY